jgi:hypothetical protein
MAFLENPLFVLFPAKILDLADSGACYEHFFIGIFKMFQKNTFRQKNFKFYAPVQKCHFGKIHNMPKGPPNPVFMQEKVQKGDFLKKDIARIDFLLLF